MKPLARIYAPIFALMVSMSLCGCQLTPNSSGNFQVTETSVGPSGRELETIRLNNCDGKADTTQVVERGQTVQIEGGAQLGVSIEVIQAAVTGKYSKGFSYKKSQMLTAPPGTNMEFTLEWTMEERVGTVAKDGQAATKAGYRYIIPTYVQISSQKDFGCAGSSQPTLPAPSASKVTPPIQPPTATPPPSASKVTPPIQPPTATPLPAPTPLADTPPGTILEIGQTWRSNGLEFTLVSTQLGTGSSYYNVGLGTHACFRLTNRRSQDLSIRYSTNNVTAQDNFRNRLNVLGCMYDCRNWSGSEVTRIIHGGESMEFQIFSGSCFYVEVDTANPSITEVIISVSGISSINNARWRIPIYH
jgi:hypothetical protein